jgi:hypothetical protein
MTDANGSARGRASALGLRVPADLNEPISATMVELTAAALSDLIGGGLLDDHVGVDAEYVVYLDEDRVAKGLPPNSRAATLSARLGWADRQWLASLRGGALFLGCNEQGNDCDVPGGVLMAARQSGLDVALLGPAASPDRPLG